MKQVRGEKAVLKRVRKRGDKVKGENRGDGVRARFDDDAV